MCDAHLAHPVVATCCTAYLVFNIYTQTYSLFYASIDSKFNFAINNNYIIWYEYLIYITINFNNKTNAMFSAVA